MIIEDKIIIAAPNEVVWQATIDVESWPLWSPAMQNIFREDSGGFKLGSSALIKQKLMPETRWIVTAFNPGNSFTWVGKVMGLEMIATHYIVPCDTGVSSMLKIELNGFIVSLFGFIMRALVSKSLKEENLGLKNYCELKVSS